MLVFVQMGDLKYGFILVGGMRGHWWPAEGTERGEKRGVKHREKGEREERTGLGERSEGLFLESLAADS